MADITITIADRHILRIKEAYKVFNAQGVEVLPTNAQLRNTLVKDFKHSIKNKVIQCDSNKARDIALQAQAQLEI